jgi:hypothetical protein
VKTHLDPDDLDRLVPRSEGTSDRTGEDLVHRTKLLSLLDPLDVSQRRLGQSSESESRSPVGGLSNRHSVDTLVDTGETFPSVDVHEDLEGRLGGGANSSLLVSRDLDSLHTCAET